MSNHTADFCFGKDCELNVKSDDGTLKLKKFTGGKNYSVDGVKRNEDGTTSIFFSNGVVLERVKCSELGSFLGAPEEIACPDKQESPPEETEIEDVEEETKKKWF